MRLGGYFVTNVNGNFDPTGDDAWMDCPAIQVKHVIAQPAPAPAYVLLVRVIRHWQTHSTFSSLPLLCALVLLFRH